MRTEIEWMRPRNQFAYNRTGGDRGRLFLANEAKRLMNPYVPFKNGVLSQNVRTYVERGHGVIHYLSPYAHYQYEGEVYGPNYPVYRDGELAGFFSPPHKTTTGQQLSYSGFRHPLATSHWDRAMWTARRGDLTRAYQAYLERG